MFSAKARANMRRLMNDYHFDLLVIGGGITGAGIALDAATRGLSVALVEMQDFAAGTSSRSTKLIHGGLRYLKQFEINLVAQTGKEREVVYRNSMHVTNPQKMLLPFYRGGTFGKYSTSLGLYVYDALAGVRKDERRTMINAKETGQIEPLLKQQGLLGGGLYVEYQTDDARLTIEILKKAAEKGALCLNYMKCQQFNYQGKKLVGAVLQDQLTGERQSISASNIVNAAGPWVDDVQQQDGFWQKHLHITKGIHIVIDRSHFPLRQATYFDHRDERMIFAIPREDKVYVGTTDTFYDQEKSNPTANEEEIAYLMDAVNEMFPAVQLKRHQIESTWAGIRPLISEEGKGPSEISRKDEIWLSPSGLVTIAGGKLTGYRKMAESVVDVIADRIARRGLKECQTEHLPISGGEFTDERELQQFVKHQAQHAVKYGLSHAQGYRLAAFYGTNAVQVFQYASELRQESSSLPLSLRAEIHYAINQEMAVTPSDFFIRRKGDLYFQLQAVESMASEVTSYMSDLLGYTDTEKAVHLNNLYNAIAEAKGSGN